MTPYADMLNLRRAANAHAWMLRGDMHHPADRWHEHAECADVRTFDTNLCTTCPARLDCLRDAVTHEDHAQPCGIRGGLTPLQRRDYYHGVVPTTPDAPRPITLRSTTHPLVALIMEN